MAQVSLEARQKKILESPWLKKEKATRDDLYTLPCVDKYDFGLGNLALTTSRTKHNLHSNAVFRRAYVGQVRHHDSYIFFLCTINVETLGAACFVEARPLFLVSSSACSPAPLTEVPQDPCTHVLCFIFLLYFFPSYLGPLQLILVPLCQILRPPC